MYDGPCAWRCHGVRIPIVFCSVQLLICRNVGSDARAPKDVACDDGLMRQMIPQLKWEIWISGAKAADKMVFERLYRSFGGVDAMVVWLDELGHAILLLHECLDGRGGLIVCDVENGFVALVRQHMMDLLECVKDITVGS